MYSYTKKNSHKKTVVIGAMSLVLAVAAAGISYLLVPHEDSDNVPVSIEEVSVPVITLPTQTEKAKRPYTVEASVVLDFYDGEASDIPSMTKFEGTYRGNQGIDYGFNKEEFDVTAIFSGKVVDVKDDPLFGHSCTVQSGDDLLITYQSLKEVRFQVNDEVKQGDAISLASTNIYNKDLGNHVHIVVEKGKQFIDPETIYDKSLAEIK